MKRLLIAGLMVVVAIIAPYGYAGMGGTSGNMNMGSGHEMMGDQQGHMLEHEQMKSCMTNMMLQMQGMMGDMEGMMKNMTPDKMQRMSKMMGEMSGQMMDMSKMMEKGEASQKEMNMMSDKMMQMKKGMSEMNK